MTEKVTSFSRHFTASMVVIDPGQARVLLVHHRAEGRWVFPGGHIDADEAPHEAAIREVREETEIEPVLFSRIDHPRVAGAVTLEPPWIVAEFVAPAKPERPGKPAEPIHRHIDMLFIGVADSLTSPVALLSEVKHARWVNLNSRADDWSVLVRAEVPRLATAAWREVTERWS